jgi:peptide/nickel transport system substrate-binding protein
VVAKITRRTGLTRKARLTGPALIATALAVILAACSGSSGGSSGSSGHSGSPTKSSASVQGITWAEQPASAPNCIFPLGPLTCETVQNAGNFQNLMDRPLYWLGDNGSLSIDPSLSLANLPVWNSSDTALTITLKPYKWSNGTAVTARDVVFFFNLIKANKADWEPYTPGDFPDNVVSFTATNATTISIKLNKSWNPNWFLYNELTQISPWPLTWDITSFPAGVTASSGTLPATPSGTLPDSTTAGAQAVGKFLAGQSSHVANYLTSPLWKVVDGPWKLSQFSSSGVVTFSRNPAYSGPKGNSAQTFTELPYTSDSAEFNELLSSTGSTSVESSSGNSGNDIAVGYIPPQDLAQAARITPNGYATSAAYQSAFDFITLNMQNAQVGPILKQLYVRQALQHLIDQPTWIKTLNSGIAAPTYGPVPLEPANSFADSFEKTSPYPYSIAAAKSLLTSHGWDVKANGTTTCADPSKCGPGITAGEALKFKLLYVSGNTALTNEMTALESNASQVGIGLQLSSGPFSQVTGSVVPICVPGNKSTQCAWQMLDWGGWVYGGYPSGEQLFPTGAQGNYGGWNSATTNKLVSAFETTSAANSAQAMDAYQDNIAVNLPGLLFMPTQGTEVAAATSLSGYSTNPFGYLAPETW